MAFSQLQSSTNISQWTISFLVLTIRLTTINNILNNIKLNIVKNDHNTNFESVCTPRSMILT